MTSEILVIVRASPLRYRTQELVDSITRHRKSSVQVVFLSPRPAERIDGVETRARQPDWVEQVRNVVAESGCRYFVTASAADRYLPGGFEAMLQSRADDGRSIVGRALIKVGDTLGEMGPRPFRFDYFALLSGYVYVAPGAVFIAARRFLDEGGFDRRCPNAAVYEYLLRTGAAGGVAVCETPVMMTEATPFPGVLPEYSLLYALDCARAALEHHRALLPAGAVLGLAAALADHINAMRSQAYYDGRLATVFRGAVDFDQRWLEYVAFRPVQSSDHTASAVDHAVDGPFVRTAADRLPFNAFGKRWVVARPQGKLPMKEQLRGVMPTRLWNVLRRTSLAWKAFRRPLT